MDSVSSWLLSIFGVIVISIVVDLLLVHSRTQKMIRCICACVTMLVIIMPISSLTANGKFEFDFSSYQTEIDEKYVLYINKLKANTIKLSLEKSLEDEGIKNVNVEILLDSNSREFVVNAVNINLSESVIDEKFEHINRNEMIKDVVIKYLKVDKSLVNIYG